MVPDRYIATSAVEKRKSLGVAPTDTLSSDTEVIATELDRSGRPRDEEVSVPKDVTLVTWEGEDDPENPMNWYITPVYH